MLISELIRMGLVKALAVALIAGATTNHALALDASATTNAAKTSDEASKGPFDLFRFGFKAFKKGDMDEALEAYRSAADQGHPGARWALANMYAYGNGVDEDDYEAFKMFDAIAREGVEPGTPEMGYFANALVSLAGYYRKGITESPIKIDLNQARQLYFHAASVFGIAEAQYQLALMMLNGEGGERDVMQAKKWLNRARKSNHVGAMATLGHVMFEEGYTVRGLALMTAALERSGPSDRDWIQDQQEKAFSLADEDVRRAAVALAGEMLAATGLATPDVGIVSSTTSTLTAGSAD